MKPITYKGYQASVEYEGGSLFIKILHIDDLLLAECENAKDVEAVARALIDEYIQTCRDEGRDPEKPFKGSLNIRMDPVLHRRAAMAAADDDVSLNAWICTAITEKIECAKISERFDGVFSRKRQEMATLETVQRLQVQADYGANVIRERREFYAAYEGEEVEPISLLRRVVPSHTGRVKLHG
ncbi:hypothetical protein A6U86_32220 [Rhizobium sp. AC27/96]|uniref:type II toxin-antitoxin system HicB family antitoxin n=1 Tax=Rhizobium sp. AC27/96 TaxID=1841653 RepID=UPI000828F230|nr:toxin-antitoxin system HicB family antitoxin [Rhizobium sp. AC27/96]OCJ02449.1 hypothetical protein A6U86_32220 [Rhizobium sp. AC27/96]